MSEFDETIAASFSPQEREALSTEAEELLKREFMGFTAHEQSLLVAFQQAGWNTSGPEWEAIEAHPNKEALARFILTSPAFRRPPEEDDEE